jgi:hypothetical protein
MCRRPVPFNWLRMLTLMERQAGWAERLSAQVAPFSMVRTERCATVITEGLCGAPTRCTELILHPSNLNDSAQKIAHVSQNYTTGADASPSPLSQQLPRLNQLLHGPRRRERTAIDNATLTICPLVKVQDGGRAQPRKMLGDLLEMLTFEYVVWFAGAGTPRHGHRF